MPKAFSGVKSGFDLIPASWFKAVVADIELRASGPTSKDPGTPYLNLVYSISEPEGQFEGRKLFDTAMLGGRGAGMGRQKLETIRPDVDWGDYDLPLEAKHTKQIEQAKEDLVGYELYCKVKHTPRRDNPLRKREEVADIMPADADMEERLWDGTIEDE